MKVVFDVDSVLIPLTEYICEYWGIDFNKLTHYRIDENDKLTEIEKKVIVREFNNPEVFEKAGFFPGIEKLNELGKDKSFELRLVTESCNAEVKDKKAKLLHEALSGVQNLNIYLIDINEKVAFLNQCDVFVEDNVETLLRCYNKYEHAILIDKPYNKLSTDTEMRYPKIKRVGSLEEAMLIIEELFKKEKERNSHSIAEETKQLMPVKKKTIIINNETGEKKKTYSLPQEYGDFDMIDMAEQHLSQWDMVLTENLDYGIIISKDMLLLEDGRETEIPEKIYKSRFTDKEIKLYDKMIEAYVKKHNIGV